MTDRLTHATIKIVSTDPRFDPAKAVLVNGYEFYPAPKSAERVAMQSTKVDRQGVIEVRTTETIFDEPCDRIAGLALSLVQDLNDVAWLSEEDLGEQAWSSFTRLRDALDGRPGTITPDQIAAQEAFVGAALDAGIDAIGEADEPDNPDAVRRTVEAAIASGVLDYPAHRIVIKGEQYETTPQITFSNPPAGTIPAGTYRRVEDIEALEALIDEAFPAVRLVNELAQMTEFECQVVDGERLRNAARARLGDDGFRAPRAYTAEEFDAARLAVFERYFDPASPARQTVTATTADMVETVATALGLVAEPRS